MKLSRSRAFLTESEFSGSRFWQRLDPEERQFMKAFDWGWNGYFPKWQTVWSPEQKRDIWRDLYRERLSYDIATPEELSDGQAPRKRTLSDYGPEDYKGLFLDSPEDSVMWLDHTPSEEAS